MPGSNAPVIEVAQLASHAGHSLGHSSWRMITQDDIDCFAALTGDDQWIHVDPERAGAGPFGASIAHGYFTLSLATPFIEEVISVTGATVALNYGSDRVRFPAPVPVGARVRAEVELPAVEMITGGVQATFHLTVEIEGRSKPGCVADVVYRYYTEVPGYTEAPGRGG